MAQNYILLERIELNAAAASVTFSNIPQSGYTDLKVVWSASGDWSGSRDLYISFNGSTSTFTNKYVEGNGASAGTGSVARYLGTVTTTTANTFTNGEVYVPNYLSSTNKSFSSDNVGEANATTAYATLAAGLWSTTSAISSIGLSPSAGNFAQYSTFSLYGLAAVGTTPAIAPKALGGSITTDGTYWIHTFNATDTFVPATNLTCDYLVVAGGGGAGTGGGGGGGAGGYRTSIGGSTLSVTAQTYTITVGAGGAFAVGTSSSGSSGTNSSFSTITSTGGGGGGGRGGTSPGLNGGSGGGEGCSVTGKGLASPTGQGNNGGAFGGGSDSGGGGGGAGAVGQDSSTKGGNGGNGLANSITGSSVTYAGGGGGGCSNGGGAGGTGGTGGGGTGGTASVGTGTNATPNTGGGGGGGGLSGSAGGNGGSGIVVIRYAV